MVKLDLKSKQKQSYQIKDIAEFNPENIGSDFQFSEINYIDTSSVTEGKLIKVQKLNRKGAPSRAKRLVKKNDILISTVRPNLKHYYLVKNTSENLVVSTGFVVIRSTKVNPLYLYYFLTTPNFIEYLVGVAESHTSAYPSFPPDIIKNAEIDLPDENTQKKIGGTLNDLDNKIENLQNQNKTLGEIAHSIFNSLFIDFNGQSEFEDSELGKIPKGWKIKKIDDVCYTYGGSTPSTKNSTYWEGDINWAVPSDLTKSNKQFLEETERKITQKGLESCSSKIHPKNSILMTSRATIGFFAITSSPCATNQGFIVTETKKDSDLYFLYSNFKNRVDEFINNANGTTFLEISRGNFRKLSILSPPEKILDNFHLTVKPLYENIEKNEKNIQTLILIRDSLLPKLISGKIKFS